MVEKVSPEEWKNIVSYDPSSGEVIWRERFVETKYDKAFNTRFAGKPVVRRSAGYILLGHLNTTYMAHRVAWAVMTGSYPIYGIDHINGIRDDNRWCNLRDVPQGENLKNQCINARNTSGRIGVLYRERDHVWCAAIYADKRQVFLGSYATRDEAVAAREAAEKVLGYHKNHGRAPTFIAASSRSDRLAAVSS